MEVVTPNVNLHSKPASVSGCGIADRTLKPLIRAHMKSSILIFFVNTIERDGDLIH